MKELHLVVTHHWWDEIVFGDKNEEYREGIYWVRRLCYFVYDKVTHRTVNTHTLCFIVAIPVRWQSSR